jgi:hypothetical protein
VLLVGRAEVCGESCDVCSNPEFFSVSLTFTSCKLTFEAWSMSEPIKPTNLLIKISLLFPSSILINVEGKSARVVEKNPKTQSLYRSDADNLNELNG